MEGHLFELCLAPIKELVSLQDDPLPLLPLLNLEGPRPIRVPPPLAGGRHIFLVHHKGGRVGQLGQEVGLRGIDGDFKGFFVHHTDPANLVCFAPQLLLNPNNVAEVGLGHWRASLGVSGTLY